MWRSLVLFLVFVTVCSAGDPKLMAECAQEYNVNLDDVLGSFMKIGQVPDESNTNSKCIFFCVNKKEGAVDANGNINVANMVAMIGPKYSSKMNAADIASLFDKCAAARNESDPCEKIYQFHKCHMQAFLSKA